MKIKDNFVLRNISGEFVIVPVGKTLVKFNGTIRVNETGAFLWNLLKDETDKKTLLEKLVAEYDIDEKTAIMDIDKFIDKLEKGGVLTNGE